MYLAVSRRCQYLRVRGCWRQIFRCHINTSRLKLTNFSSQLLHQKGTKNQNIISILSWMVLLYLRCPFQEHWGRKSAENRHYFPGFSAATDLHDGLWVRTQEIATSTIAGSHVFIPACILWSANHSSFGKLVQSSTFLSLLHWGGYHEGNLIWSLRSLRARGTHLVDFNDSLTKIRIHLLSFFVLFTFLNL